MPENEACPIHKIYTSLHKEASAVTPSPLKRLVIATSGAIVECMHERSARPKLPLCTRRAVARLTALLLVILIGGCAMFRMPGRSHDGPLRPLDSDDLSLRDALMRDIQKLAGDIGERNVFRPTQLAAASTFVEDSFREVGYEIERQEYEALGHVCANIIVEKRGTTRPEEIVVIGAHYDSAEECPAANDNATGVAAVLALARSAAQLETARTLRFVAFVNEEPPFFQTPQMGSLVYASRCRARNENIVAMLSLETIGYYSSEPKSQRYPFPFGLIYPSTGDFIGFMGNFSSRKLVRQCVGAFREHGSFPSEGGAVPAIVPELGFSDHWAFWQHGYKAIMVTDTAFFRYGHYHTTEDTPDKIQYDNLARVVRGLQGVVQELATSDAK